MQKILILQKNEIYIKRCLELARNGQGNVSPNPMVAAVVVCEDKIIGEGFHQKFGDAHAEVNAINSVKDNSLLCKSTIYVSLEPCSHFGKTPPCADLIIKSKIREVVIGSQDPNPIVAGKGIEKLKNAGIDVIANVLQADCEFLNRRFYTFHRKKRPYIILKWAESANGFIDIKRSSSKQTPIWFTDNYGKTLVHKWRSEEDAILLGKNSVILDNPQLTTRNYFGKNPIRIVITKNNFLDKNYYIFDSQAQTIIFNSEKNEVIFNVNYVKIDFNEDLITQILQQLYSLNINSLIVEGGSFTLNSFIKQNLWVEARVFTSNLTLNNGVKSPEFCFIPSDIKQINNYFLKTYYNDFNRRNE